MTTPSNMFMAKSTYASTRVTGISVRESDTDSSHFSFAIYVDPEDFCKAIDEIITSYNDNSAYYVFQDITIPSDSYTITFSYCTDSNILEYIISTIVIV